MTTAVHDTDLVAAEALWNDLRDALVNFDEAVMAIIEARAWEPLGYSTFAEAWADRMQGTRLATTRVAAAVVYALIESGATRDDALLALGPSSGVGPAKFDALARQKEAGVPPELATTRVRSHLRSVPTEARVVHVELTPDEYTHFKALADAHGSRFADEAAKAVRAHFRRMERRSSRG